MDFSFTEGQSTLKQSVIEFATKTLNRDIRKRDQEQQFSRESWLACAKFGIQGLPVPKEYGGGGVDIVTTVLAMEGLGYGCRDNGLIFSLNAHMWSLELPLIEFGTTDQKKNYLPGLASGDMVGAYALTEAESGSDAFNVQTRAEKHGEQYVLNGSKMYITNAPIADLVIIFASTNPGQGFAGMSAFLVEKDRAGFSVGRSLDKMGLRTSPMAEIILTDCTIPESNRLGSEGSGLAVFNSSIEWERSGILATSVGTMQRQLENCIRYAKNRRQFGQPIGKFQSVSNKIADMYVRLEATRNLIYKVAWLKQEGKSALAEAAAAKIVASESWVETSLDAIQIHGAFGYMTESEIERDLRDSIAGKIYSGTSELQRMIIARILGL